ncbi:MAG: signal recognition particle protein [Deltaproteobacteria bacterium]|nr:signal recognition particle protein [Deltaproteobacteria bacterium]
MFETLTKGFRAAKNRLQGLAEITEENIDQALRDVRMSLLEADVEFSVTRNFLAKVKEHAVGEVVKTKIEAKGKTLRATPAEHFIKICQDRLTELMGPADASVAWAPKGTPTGIMMVGLQGSGKTTTAAKLARWIAKKGKRPLLVAADLQRPAAIEQLQILGEQVEIPVFSQTGITPVEVCDRAMSEARRRRCDVVIFDTAGRLAIDELLMKELADIKSQVKPKNVFLVVDAMIGQDSVKTAASFNQRLGLTGVILTKLDGDARGGAAISVKEVTGTPIKFVGVGESLEKLEEFRPDGMASRILGFGDIVGLMKDFEEVVDDEDKAEADAARMLKGRFTFEDFLEQIRMLQKMGSMKELMEKMPFFPDGLPEGATVDDKELKKIESIIHSMTPQERRRPDVFEKNGAARIKRIALGSGRKEKDIGELLHKFRWMRDLMGSIGQQAGLLSRIPGLKQLAMAKRLREAVKVQGQNPAISGIADHLLEAAVAGDGRGVPGMRKRPGLDAAKRKKAKLKQQKKARKKSRRR